MRTTRRTAVTLLAAAGFAAVSTLAYAFPPGAGPCAGQGPGMARSGGPGPMAWSGGPGFRGGHGAGPGAGVAANPEARLAYLKNALKITSDQEAAWNAYEAQVKERVQAMAATRGQMAAPAESAPDRLAQRSALMKQRAAGMEAMTGAVKDLYAALTPEQKTVADQHFGGWRMAQAGGRGYGPGHGMRGYGPRW
jgi:hypothetical protein